MDVLMGPEQARRILHLLIESIQIFPEPMPDGLILKSVKFRIPLEYEGDEVWGAEVDMSAYDSLPDENHDETVCLLSKLRAEHHIEVELNLDELDLTAAESKATYDEIKAYVLEQFGLKVSSLYISQVKRKCGLEVGENYNLAKSENAKVPTCPPEKEKAIRAALEHFRMLEGGGHQ